jgi:hypothetical protein
MNPCSRDRERETKNMVQEGGEREKFFGDVLVAFLFA